MDKPREEVKDCGCVILHYKDRQQYEPCLPHALDHAGKMLCAAAMRAEQVFGMWEVRSDQVKKAPEPEVPSFEIKGKGTVTNPEEKSS